MKNNYELREVTINEWIWIIFIILSASNVFGDELEKKSLQSRECHDEKARIIFLKTATIAIIIYFYFVINSYKKLQQTKIKNQDTRLREIQVLGNSLIFVGALLVFYFNINNKNQITTQIP